MSANGKEVGVCDHSECILQLKLLKAMAYVPHLFFFSFLNYGSDFKGVTSDSATRSDIPHVTLSIRGENGPLLNTL